MCLIMTNYNLPLKDVTQDGGKIHELFLQKAILQRFKNKIVFGKLCEQNITYGRWPMSFSAWIDILIK